MIDKNIKERSRVLRIALDQGHINLKELRAFLVTVESELPPATRKTKGLELREHHKILLNKGNKRIRKTS